MPNAARGSSSAIDCGIAASNSLPLLPIVEMLTLGGEPHEIIKVLPAAFVPIVASARISHLWLNA